MASLSDLTYYNNRSQGGIGEEEVNTPAAQDMLAALRKYDPHAEFSPTLLGGEGTSGQVSYTLNFDPRLLPGVGGTGQLSQGAAGVATGNTFMPSFSTVQDHMQLRDPGAVTNSPDYGRITDNTNIEQQRSLLDVLGPAAVLAFGAFAPGLLGQFSTLGAGETAGSGAWGMADRGLGVAGGAGSEGTLSASDIAALQDGTGYGMYDRGLGTTANGGLGSGAEGTLTASQIADLRPGLLSRLPNFLSKLPGLLGTPGGSGGGGSGLLGQRQPQQYENLSAILKRYYGNGHG